MTKVRKRSRLIESDKDQWLSQRKAADLLKVSRQTLLGMAARGELRTTVAAGRLLISRASVLARQAAA